MLALADSAATESPEAAEGQGEKADLADITCRPTNHLDSLVPEYKTARAGAAGFIGAENALDAGLKLVTNKNVTAIAEFVSLLTGAIFAIGVVLSSQLRVIPQLHANYNNPGILQPSSKKEGLSAGANRIVYNDALKTFPLAYFTQDYIAEALGAQVPNRNDSVGSKERDPEPAELTSTSFAIGDKLDIKLFQQLGTRDRPESAGAGALSALIERPELSGTYIVQQDGSITLPLLGTFNLLGASQQQIIGSIKS